MQILICDICRKEDKGIKTIQRITFIGLKIKTTHSPTYELCAECQQLVSKKIEETIILTPSNN